MSKAQPFLIFTVMKNEGPFILEWIAYHHAIGVDKFLVFTNDCDDRTDDILDRLDALGLVRHVPNPVTMGKRYFGKDIRPHIAGLDYATHHQVWKEAAWIYVTDVDEFLDINVGDGTLEALMDAAGQPDILTLTERIFGTGLIEHYEPGLVIDQFTRCSSLRPGKWRARRGVKSICRNLPDVIRIRNHRPMVSKDQMMAVKWVDGSGQDLPQEFRTDHIKGIDCRGRYDLAAVNHYTLRSLESFLCKVDRGDAVVTHDSRLDWDYFRKRNRIDDEITSIQRHKPLFQKVYDDLLSDPVLAALHAETVALHQAKINRLKAEPKHAALWELLQGSLETSRSFIQDRAS